MTNTICLGKTWNPFRWEGKVLYAYFYKENAWLPVKRTNKKNKYGDYIFEKY